MKGHLGTTEVLVELSVWAERAHGDQWVKAWSAEVMGPWEPLIAAVGTEVQLDGNGVYLGRVRVSAVRLLNLDDEFATAECAGVGPLRPDDPA